MDNIEVIAEGVQKTETEGVYITADGQIVDAAMLDGHVVVTPEVGGHTEDNTGLTQVGDNSGLFVKKSVNLR